MSKWITGSAMGHTDWEDSFFPSTVRDYRIAGTIGSGTYGEVPELSYDSSMMQDAAPLRLQRNHTL